MTIKRSIILALFFFCASLVLAQNSRDEVLDEFSYFGEFSLVGIGSSEDYVPFWFHTNTSTAIGQYTNLSSLASLNGRYSYKENVFMEVGTTYLYREGIEVDNLQRRDLYVQFTSKWFKVTLGSKQRDIAFFGLSSTNQNYLWSNNARPLPGLIIEANEPIKLFEHFKVDWGIAHYELNDNRFVDNARLHYKRLNIITQLSKRSKITAGLQHFVQWAGTSPVFGALKKDFTAFTNVFIANKTTEIGVEGEIQNAVGNHLGSYLLRYDLSLDQGAFAFYHEHPFEDGSGTRLQNFPDGVWGLTFAPKSNKIIKGILYEYVDTRSQSRTKTNNRTDSYFSNLVYRSGWSYEQNIIGHPFFKINRNPEGVLTSGSYFGTRFQVHHLGVTGNIKNISWSLKTSYSKNLGRFGTAEFDIALEDFYSALQLEYIFKKSHNFKLLGGFDVSSNSNNVVGAGISYSYTFQK